MRLRITDGSDILISSCTQEFEEEAKYLVCKLKGDFDEITELLNKDQISEILTVYDKDDNMIFQTTEYKKVVSIVNDIQSGIITIKFGVKDEEE